MVMFKYNIPIAVDMHDQLALPDLTDGISLEDAFILLQRELLKVIVGPVAAAGAVDYFEAGGPTGAFELLSGKPVAQYLFIEQAILKDSAANMENHYVPISKKDDPAYDGVRQIALESFLLFNPQVVYSSFLAGWNVHIDNALPSVAGEEDNGSNLFILRRTALTTLQENRILERASLYRNILAYSQEYYTRRNTSHRAFIDPWQRLRLDLEELMIKIDPTLRFEFTKVAVIQGWMDADPDGYFDEGYYVVEEGSRVPLINTFDRDRFSGLPGKAIVYHSYETSPWGGKIDGKLLAVLEY
jgi:hypothetical protein